MLTNKTAENTKNTSDFEKYVQHALKSFGFLFPSTEEDVIEFEKRCGNTEVILPEQLREPDFLYTGTNPQDSLKVLNIYESHAHAARNSNGSYIPDEVRERMKKDRVAKRNDKIKK